MGLEQRNAIIKQMRENGYTLNELGRLFGLTRQRIDQIVNREKARARGIAWSRPMPDGQKCQECGEPAEERHHDNYDEPLDFMWLCRQCHKEKHHPNGPTVPITIWYFTSGLIKETAERWGLTKIATYHIMAEVASQFETVEEFATQVTVPKLLAACKKAADYLETVEQFGWRENKLMEQLEAALAEALGQEAE